MKKIIIPLIVFTALFLIIYSPEKESRDIDIKSSLENDLIEIREDKILSEKAGLSFDIPKGWNVERDGDEVELLSPDYIKGDSFPERGCQVRFGVTDFIKEPGQKRRPDDIREMLKYDDQKVVIVSKREAIENLLSKSDRGRIVLVEIPIDDVIAHIGIAYPTIDQSECDVWYGKIMDSVIIK